MNNEVMTVAEVLAAEIPDGKNKFAMQRIQYDLSIFQPGKSSYLKIEFDENEAMSLCVAFTSLLRLANGETIGSVEDGRESMRRDVLKVVDDCGLKCHGYITLKKLIHALA
jgi:hypothetical protein